MHLTLITQNVLVSSSLCLALKRKNISYNVFTVNSILSGWQLDTDAIYLDPSLNKSHIIKISKSLADISRRVPLMYTEKSLSGIIQMELSILNKRLIYLSAEYELHELVELILCVLLRHHDSENPQSQFIELLPKSQNLRYFNKTISLTRKEYYLMDLLIQNSGKITTREAIIQYVWDRRQYVSQNTIDVYISRLRKKIRSKRGKQIIKTIPCLGYELKI
jgi:DNA-binding response OmpR family regulator